MKRWMKIVCAAVFSFAFLFVSVGYASLSGSLAIAGNVDLYLAPIYIKSATPLAAYADRATVNLTTETTLNNTVTLSTAQNTVIYKIVVNNRSSDLYGYLATEADPALYANSKISYSLYTNEACTKKLERQTELPACVGTNEGSITFYLKISGKSVTSTDAEFQSILNFVFKTPISEIPSPDKADDEVAVDNAMDKFKKILNTPSSFSTLTTQMTGEGMVDANDRWDDSYIAYVPATIGKTNSSGRDFTDDNVALALFGGELNLIIEGTQYQVYFLLKRENVDNSTATGDANGEEYTLYMTTNPLTDSSSLWSTKYAVVYAAVFTSDDDGTSWYQLGDMLTGEAPICDYDGGGFGSSFGRPSGSGSFHTDSWKTTEAYYGVSSGKTVADVMSAAVSDLTALQAQIEAAETIMSNEYYETIYTEASRANMESVLEVAREINSNSSSYTQAQVVSAAKHLSEVIAALEDAV